MAVAYLNQHGFTSMAGESLWSARRAGAGVRERAVGTEGKYPAGMLGDELIRPEMECGYRAKDDLAFLGTLGGDALGSDSLPVAG